MAGESFTVGATLPAGTQEVYLEVETDRDSPLHRIRAEKSPLGADTSTSGTHLAAAALAEEVARGREAWRALVPGLEAGTQGRYRLIAGATRTRWHQVASFEWLSGAGRLRLDASPEVAGRLVEETLAWLVGADRAVRLRFELRLDPGEHVVGFGERFNALDQRGRRLDAQVFEQYKGQGDRTYLPMPFAIVAGGHGWGFHVATARRSWFDVGVDRPDRLAVEVDLDPEQAEPDLDLSLYAGDPSAVLGQFLDQTGRPALPPSWVFGLWMSANEWNTQARVMKEVARTHEEGIPAGVVVIEAWSDEATFTAFRGAQYRAETRPHPLADYTFPPDGPWPDPKGMVDELHRRGMRVLLWQIPLLKQMPNPPPQLRIDRAEMLEGGYYVQEGGGRPYRNRGWWFPGSLMPDFTSAAARRWWTAKRRYLVEELGVDGFKTDGGEHAWGDDLRYADGTRGGAGNNPYPVAYAAAFHELFRDVGRDGVTFSRAGFTGSQSYPCHWAGDEDSTWEAFRASILAGITAGACGIYFWGWDLAGFSGEIPSAELYLRSAGAACFSPIMQYHSEFNGHRLPSRDRTPWNIAERTGDARVLPVFRRFVELRRRLQPYLVEQAKRAIKNNKPLMRALMFDFPSDPAIWHWPLQYQLGDDILVAPVVEPGATAWTAYLPEGRWTHFWTGEEVIGPTLVERAAPIDQVPVWVLGPAARKLIGSGHVKEI